MTRRSRQTLVLVVAAVGAATAWATRSRGPTLPLFARGGSAPVQLGPVPAGLDGIDAEQCGRCHAEIVAEWRGSMHAKAWVDPVFQEAYAVEPLAECRNCHAPENDGGEPTGRVAAEGVSCAACHIRAGKVLAGHGGRSGPHALYATRHLDSSAMCAGCHQFNFLGFVSGGSAGAGHHVETDEAQQDTFGEWETSRSRRAKETCQDCHMPWKTTPSGRAYRSHTFPGGFDDALVKEAVSATVTAQRTAEGIEVSVRFTPGRVGHAFPTGDLFRRAELRAWLPSQPDRVAVFPLARAFRDRTEPQANGQVMRVRRETSDTRVPPPGNGPPAVRKAVIAVGPTLTPQEMARVSWTFDYHLMPTPGTASAGGDPVHSTHIADGETLVSPQPPERSDP